MEDTACPFEEGSLYLICLGPRTPEDITPAICVRHGTRTDGNVAICTSPNPEDDLPHAQVAGRDEWRTVQSCACRGGLHR